MTAAVAAGAFSAPGDRVLPALLAGAGVTGAFMVFGALYGHRRDARSLAIGGLLFAGGPCLALAAGAPPAFLACAGAAAVPAVAAVVLGRVLGSLATSTIVCATLAIACGAPVAAVAGGRSGRSALLLLLLLAPFYAWRTLRVRASFARPAAERPPPRTTGLREARHAAIWCLLVVGLSRLL